MSNLHAQSVAMAVCYFQAIEMHKLNRSHSSDSCINECASAGKYSKRYIRVDQLRCIDNGMAVLESTPDVAAAMYRYFCC